ncbi:MAG: hypothetical protein WAU53_00525 [Rhodoplanes sp.]
MYEYVGRAVIAPIAGSVTPRRNQEPKRDEWRSEQDLQAQWDMARFALWGAFAAWAGVFVTGVGIFFVWRTLEANRDAVRQAQRTADIAEEAFRRLERPYLLIKITETFKLQGKIHGEPTTPGIRYTLVNYGKLPAILRSVSIGLLNNPTFPLISTFEIAETKYEVITPDGELLNPRSVEVRDCEAGENFAGVKATTLVLYGILEYDDPTGARHTDSFVMRGKTGGSAFHIEGGEEYNWHTTTYPQATPTNPEPT